MVLISINGLTRT